MANSTIVGAAGEHYVMCQLLRLDLIAALAPAGVPNADIVVTNQAGERLFVVQVKVRTERGVPGAWQMQAKHETMISPYVFYCFVDFGERQPKCWVVPANVVAEVLTKSHKAWLARPGVHGQPHNDNNLRRFRKCYANEGLGSDYAMGWLEPYFENWGQLKDPEHPPAI